MNFDVMELANILRDAARAEALPRFRRLDASMVSTKTEAIDLVTEADIATEEVIKARMAQWMPEALFVGDSRSDVQAAKAAGVLCVAMSYGYNHGEPISTESPALVLDDLRLLLPGDARVYAPGCAELAAALPLPDLRSSPRQRDQIVVVSRTHSVINAGLLKAAQLLKALARWRWRA